MPNFDQLSPEDLIQYDKVLGYLELANSPTKEGAVARMQIQQMGGIDPEKAKAVGQYRAWKYKLNTTLPDRNKLIAGGVPAEQVDQELQALQKENQEKIDNTYAHFIQQTENNKPVKTPEPVKDMSGDSQPKPSAQDVKSGLDNTLLNIVKFMVQAPKNAQIQQQEYQGKEEDLAKKLQNQLVAKLLPKVKSATATPEQLNTVTNALGLKK